MAWSRTLAQLVSDVALRCDVDGYTARHPTANIRRLVIESYQRLRDWMTSNGSQRFVVGPITLDATGAGIEQLGYAVKIPLVRTVPVQPSGIEVHYYERLSLVEAQIDGRWRELRPVSTPELRDYYQSYSTSSLPEAWAYEGASAEATSSGAYCVIIAPAFDPTTLPVRIYGVTDTTLADSDSTSLTLDAPGFEWIIWDSVIKISARDNDSQGTFAIANQERAKQEAEILQAIRGEQRVVRQRRDVFHGLNRFRQSRRY